MYIAVKMTIFVKISVYFVYETVCFIYLQSVLIRRR